jgi:hypothetical protein
MAELIWESQVKPQRRRDTETENHFITHIK